MSCSDDDEPKWVLSRLHRDDWRMYAYVYRNERGDERCLMTTDQSKASRYRTHYGAQIVRRRLGLDAGIEPYELST